MYRVRKSWNNGKWTKDQIGAYSNLNVAIGYCTSELVNEGYKVFDDNGNVVYPPQTDDTAEMMVSDGVSADVKYWTDVFNGIIVANPSYIKSIVNRYHDNVIAAAKRNCGYEIVVHNDIPMFKIDINRFKIKWVDTPKNNLYNSDQTLCFNLGYFESFSEDGHKFTLPVGNLVADIDFESITPVAIKYIKERSHTNNRISVTTNTNSSSQFKGHSVSTLCIKQGKAWIDSLTGVALGGADYAVSGAPIIRDGKCCTTRYKTEGWDNSIVRSTYHGFMGVTEGGSLYYFRLATSSNNCITSKEVYNKISDFNFIDVIKVDGGGSFMLKSLDSSFNHTESGNRVINNVGGIF